MCRSASLRGRVRGPGGSNPVSIFGEMRGSFLPRSLRRRIRAESNSQRKATPSARRAVIRTISTTRTSRGPQAVESINPEFPSTLKNGAYYTPVLVYPVARLCRAKGRRKSASLRYRLWVLKKSVRKGISSPESRYGRRSSLLVGGVRLRSCRREGLWWSTEEAD